MQITCPNCEAIMDSGDSCPECDHTDVRGVQCSCAACMNDEDD